MNYRIMRISLRQKFSDNNHYVNPFALEGVTDRLAV